MTIDGLESITLANAAGGHIEGAFQDALAIVSRELRRCHEGVYDVRDKEVAAEITIKVRASVNVEGGFMSVSGGVTNVSLPKRTRRAGIAFLAGDRIQVEKAHQADLFNPGDTTEAWEGGDHAE